MTVLRADQQYLDNVWPNLSIEAGDNEDAIAHLRQLQTRSRAAWADMHGKHTRAMADPTKTEAARMVASAKFAKTILEAQRLAFVDAKKEATEKLQAKQRQLQRALNPPSDPGEAILFGEIRAKLREMKAADRIEAVEAAIAAGGDRRVAHAALSGPDLTALLPPALVAQFRDSYWVTVMPNEWGATQRLDAALAEAQTGMDRLEQHAAKLVDFQTADAYERAAV